MDIKNTKEYKKCVFLASKRAMLENELLLREFVKEFVPSHYDLETLGEFNIFLEKIFDNDLFDIIFGIKPYSYYADKYPEKFLKDIQEFAFEKNRISEIRNKSKKQ
ncbi:succinate dehydrogenase assembly factor 2 [Deferribacter thermophilus]|uniref:succinate dehydrogenase assembly factor 2 n=1 Tax=Deferribacter thermophilus TaxID=53573 RepID=UPI003C1FB914